MMEIETKRLTLRPLKLADVSEKYLSWLTDKSSEYIEYGKRHPTMDDLMEYVQDKINDSNVLFLGIFDSNNAHIGNIKYEPIDLENRTATMGILIGDVNWRGLGVAGEVITASAIWLQKNKDIREVNLVVDPNNIPAIAAYKKIGFKEAPERINEDRLVMVWTL